MNQPETSQPARISSLAQPRRTRSFRRRKAALASGLFALALLFLMLLTRQARPAVAVAETAQPNFYRLEIKQASPALVRARLQECRAVIIYSPEHPQSPDTIADMAAYFSFFRDRYFDVER